jgi:electron transfer flavoprotein beta subunit
VEKGSCVPRLPSYRLRRQTAGRPVRICGFSDLPQRDLSRCGLVGSPTHVENLFAPPVSAKRVELTGSAREKAAALVKILLEKKLMEGGAGECLS